jgi:hypothetical protein
MPRPHDFLLVGLCVSSCTLAFIALRQQAEIRALRATVVATRTALPPGAGTMTIHSAAQRRFAVPPQTERAAVSQPGTGGDDNLGVPDFSSGSAPKAKSWRRQSGEAMARLMEDPQFVNALSLQRRAMLDARFGELFRQLNLQGEELATFKQLLSEKENVALEVVTLSDAAPEGPLRPDALRAAVRAAQTQIEQAIHSSLGSDRYAVYRDYERTIAHRATVAQLEQRLSYTNAPLTPAQADTVVRILSQTTPPAATEEPVPPVSVLVRSGVPEAIPLLPANAGAGRVTEEAITQAQTVLTQRQVEALREIQLEQQAAMQAAQMIRDAAPVTNDMIPTWPTLLLN